MIKVGLYLENKNISEVDLSKPEEGNPGIGGTQYNFITMPYYFKKYIKNQIEFVWYANTTDKLPSEIESVKVDTCIEGAKTASKQGCDIFIWRPTTDAEGLEFINKMDSFSIDIVAWVHNTPGFKALNKMNDSSKLKRFVCVSQEQLDRLRDHNIFYKSKCIFNGFDPKEYIPQDNIKKDDNMVTYVGSLVPAKGFHHLARVWPKILKEIENAKLVVIGSGKLYNRNQSLGKWNIAEENYEKKWRKYLADENGNIHKSVEFKGTLGSEKITIMQKSKVGVVNPSGRTENCPGSAIEFQAAGTPVVSGGYRGLFDTVVDQKTGLLGRNDKELINNIVYLLKNNDKARKYGDNGMKFIKKKFSHKRISKQWLNLFNDVYNGKPNKTHNIKQHPFNDYKLLREIWRYTKKYVPGLKKAPSLSELKFKIKKVIK
ncbi:glycosyl transferase family 1 [Halanaerobium congolense]|uniref:Glycosyl transferase family 1 n=1 Tax=Halanaerobium congolense TaxID=54121 RepID=A0A318E2V9_9FIRM|nr:glycosyltransferase family 4 protein [Halanaerobium congolense]PXV62288.1 glycosyl transferase family 1 [Halanaerobium congolense]